MSMIQVNNLTFGYDGSIENIFNNVSFIIDTNWKLGLIGRNGKGKTTFLKLLLGEYKYLGNISKSVNVEYFPFEIKNKNRMTIEIVNEIAPEVQEWQIIKELNLLNANIEILYRNFNTLSGGEEVKVLLATLFLKENNFLLIDEPTNHLDIEAKENLVEYLKNKNSFILVSHDRIFLDKVVDHIISINNTNIDIQKGNFTSWKENKDKQDNFEQTENEKLKKDISRLEIASKKKENWSNLVEKSKKKTATSEKGFLDRGFIGHKSAKMMKSSKVLETRQNKAMKEKSELLKNIDKNDSLVMKPLNSKKNPIVFANDLQIKYDNKIINNKISFEVNNMERIAIVGKNGCGKSSILKLIRDKNINYMGEIKIANDIKISYVSQSTEYLKGTLKEMAIKSNIDEGIFKAMLTKLGVTNIEFEKDIKEFSEGQKKKVLIAKSITESANLYIWDEPLNYIDILSRIQIEEVILKYMPTMIFVEHDKTFVNNVATKIIYF